MSNQIFREGGPHHIKRVGHDKYRMTVTIPKDEDGRVARKCPDGECSPGYFTVKTGTGILDGQDVAYCPYCRRSADPSDFTTREQVRYATDLALKEAHEGFNRCSAMPLDWEHPESGRWVVACCPSR